MSKETKLREQLDILSDIKSIISAMKNLSFIEITKLNRFISAQSTMSDVITEALDDFEIFFQPTNAVAPGQLVYILLGSERGFCGGFNDRIFEKMMERSREAESVPILVVGHRLFLKCEGRFPNVLELAGPSAVEEIPTVLSELTRNLENENYQRTIFIHNSLVGSHIQTHVTDPLLRQQKAPRLKPKYPPWITVPPKDLYAQLFEHYLFAIFYRVLYQSFLAENHERLRHMDGALIALQKKFDDLRLKHNMLRQEAITEELELLMLNKSLSRHGERA
jgi:F-type H+-transporting ATPase subunit gamma